MTIRKPDYWGWSTSQGSRYWQRSDPTARWPEWLNATDKFCVYLEGVAHLPWAVHASRVAVHVTNASYMKTAVVSSFQIWTRRPIPSASNYLYNRPVHLCPQKGAAMHNRMNGFCRSDNERSKADRESAHYMICFYKLPRQKNLTLNGRQERWWGAGRGWKGNFQCS